MKISELKALINEIIKEEFAKAPKFGDIQPTDEKTGERPGMQDRPNDGMDISQQKEMLNSSEEKLDEMCALATGAVGATSDGSGMESKEKQKEKHEQMWSEEKLGKNGPNGVTYFQMGSSLTSALYNQKDGKPSRDPGVAGIKKKLNESSDGTILACRSGHNYNFNPAKDGSLGPGYYFTTNPERAKRYGDGSIVWVKIKLKNPLVGSKSDIVEKFGINDHVDSESGAYNFDVGGEFNKQVREYGYDGIIAQEKNGKTYEIIVFDPNSFEPVKNEQ